MNPARKDTPIVAPQRDPWMSLNEACIALDTHREKVLQRALAGELEVQIVAGRTVVSRASVERMLAGSPAEPA